MWSVHPPGSLSTRWHCQQHLHRLLLRVLKIIIILTSWYCQQLCVLLAYIIIVVIADIFMFMFSWCWGPEVRRAKWRGRDWHREHRTSPPGKSDIGRLWNLILYPCEFETVGWMECWVLGTGWIWNCRMGGDKLPTCIRFLGQWSTTANLESLLNHKDDYYHAGVLLGTNMHSFQGSSSQKASHCFDVPPWIGWNADR